jgi:hypothetical protein
VIEMAIEQSAVQDLQRLAREWARQHVRAGSLEEAEAVAVEVSRIVGQAVAEEALAGTPAASYEGCSRPCACGRKAKFMDYRGKGLVTLAGEVRVKRAYYYCSHCQTGVAPWDAAQGLSHRCYSPGVKAVVAETAVRMPYGGGMEFLARLTPLRIEESAAELIVQEVGGRVREAQAEATEQYLSGLVPLPIGPPVKRLYVTMDGSSAHIDGAWHEVKSGAVYEAQPGDDEVDRSGPKRYVSAQEPAEEFTARLYVEALQAGVHRADEVVVLGDGAEWIWNHAAVHYPGATEIVDYWHACQHIHDLAKVQYGEGSSQGQRWAREHCTRLKEEGPAAYRRALRRMKPRSPDAAEKLRTERGYFDDNASRMRYPQFREKRLMIGSGIAEAACKVVVGQRLKQAGMRWKHRGADHILALRCLVLNNQHDDIRRFAQAA